MAAVEAVWSRELNSPPLRRSGTVLIANGAALSDAYPGYMAGNVAIQMPAAWTAANITFQVQGAPGAAFAELSDAAGAAISLAVTTDEALPVPQLAGWYAFKIRSGTVGVPVNQGADRTLIVQAWD